jgi:Flp pilus assembly pilin Flp
LDTRGTGFKKIVQESIRVDDIREKFMKNLRRNKNKRGQTLVEYALILAFISVVAISVLIRLGGEVKTIFTTITSQLAIAGSSH